MRILLLQNTQSRYNVLEDMTSALSAAFMRQGIEAKIFDAWDKGPSELQQDVDRWQPDCTFGINIFAHKELPHHIALSVDALNHCSEFLDPSQPPVLFADAWSCSLYAAQGGRTAWFPHAISKEFLDKSKAMTLCPLKNRPFDSVLIGSFMNADKELAFWRDLFSPKDVEALVFLVEKILENPLCSIQHEVLAFLSKTPSVQEVLTKNALSLPKFISSVEQYMRGLDRTRLIRSLSGKRIHIFGEGWEHVPSHVVLHPPLPFSSVFEVCQQAKVVLNSVPMIRRGYHERLFLGLAAGALVVTSQINIPDAAGIPSLVQYTTSSLTTLQDRLATWSEVPPPFGWMENFHTWDARVKRLLPFLTQL